MTAKAGYSTPMLHVASIERSIHFYELLGFATIDTDGCDPIGWARIHCEGGALMFLRGEDGHEPVDGSKQAFMLYMYTDDLVDLRENLLANGVKVPPISRPPYMPSGEIMLADPDGYKVLVAHWGKAEQQAWEKRLQERKSSA